MEKLWAIWEVLCGRGVIYNVQTYVVPETGQLRYTSKSGSVLLCGNSSI